MIFSILIYTSHNGGQSEQTAIRFVRSALSQGHTIHRVFFYGESVTTASSFKVTPRDEANLSQHWQELIEHHNLDLVICIASAVKRGVLDEGEANRHQKPAATLEEGFSLSGLGQLADAILKSDKVITFGN